MKEKKSVITIEVAIILFMIVASFFIGESVGKSSGPQKAIIQQPVRDTTKA